MGGLRSLKFDFHRAVHVDLAQQDGAPRRHLDIADIHPLENHREPHGGKEDDLGGPKLRLPGDFRKIKRGGRDQRSGRRWGGLRGGGGWFWILGQRPGGIQHWRRRWPRCGGKLSFRGGGSNGCGRWRSGTDFNNGGGGFTGAVFQGRFRAACRDGFDDTGCGSRCFPMTLGQAARPIPKPGAQRRAKEGEPAHGTLKKEAHSFH